MIMILLSNRPAVFIVVWLVFSLLVSSCHEQGNALFIQYVPQYSIQYQDEEISFILDDETSLDFEKWRFHDGLGLFYFANRINRSIYIYEIGKEEPLLVVPIEREGPNGIPQIEQVYVHNPDSIFVLSQYGDHVVHLLNQEGERMDKFVIRNRQNQDLGGTSGSQFGKNDFFFADNKLLLPVGSLEETEKSKKSDAALLVFDIKSREKTFLLNYPSKSHDYNFFLYSGMSFGAWNPSNERYFLSFPYDHHVYYWSMENNEIHSTNQINPNVRLAEKGLEENGQDYIEWFMVYHSWYDKMLVNPMDGTLWRTALAGWNIDRDNRTYNPETSRNSNGERAWMYTFLYNADGLLTGKVNESLLLTPVLFHQGKMFKMVPNSDPETAENKVIFRSFSLELAED